MDFVAQNTRMSRNLTVDHKLSARTAPEMYAEFKRLVQDLELGGVKFRDRKVGLESVLNAILVRFFDLPPEQREELIRENLPRFEAVMDSDKPVLLPVPIGIKPDMVLLGGAAPEEIHASRPVVAKHPKQSKSRRGAG